MDLVSKYIQDLKVEGIKLQLQICSPHAKEQHNSILGKFDFEKLDGPAAVKIIRNAIDRIEATSSYEELFDLFEEWNKERTVIQYQGYFNDPKRRTEAWCYVFLKRILKNHKDLYDQIYGR